MNSIKQWLTDNKIYFETVAAVLLSAMALIVSTSQLWIAKTQTRLQLAEQSPQFFVKSYIVKNLKSGFYDDEVLDISNNGGLARDVDPKSAVFIDISLTVANGQRQIQKSIPLIGYFYVTKPTGNLQGTLYTLLSHQNKRKMGDLKQQFRSELENNKDIQYGELLLRKYVRISFETIHNKKSVEYYKVGGELMDVEDGKKIFAEFYDKSPIDLDHATAKTLISLATTEEDR